MKNNKFKLKLNIDAARLLIEGMVQEFLPLHDDPDKDTRRIFCYNESLICGFLYADKDFFERELTKEYIDIYFLDHLERTLASFNGCMDNEFDFFIEELRKLIKDIRIWSNL